MESDKSGEKIEPDETYDRFSQKEFHVFVEQPPHRESP